MKKVLKFFLWINAAALFILNLSVSLNLVNADSVKLTLKQEQALADECGVKCDNVNGYKNWAVNGIRLREFYDCCYVLRQGYDPQGSCQ